VGFVETGVVVEVPGLARVVVADLEVVVLVETVVG